LTATYHCEARPDVAVLVVSPVQVRPDLVIVPVAVRHVGLASTVQFASTY
jgi:hypothetical protein